MYSKTDLIFVVTTKLGYIPQLRMNGPIPTPVKIDVATCISILTTGCPLWQFDPATKKVVELTLTNILHDNKFNTVVVDVVEPKIEKLVLSESNIITASKVEVVAEPVVTETDTAEEDDEEIVSDVDVTSNDTVEDIVTYEIIDQLGLNEEDLTSETSEEEEVEVVPETTEESEEDALPAPVVGPVDSTEVKNTPVKNKKKKNKNK